MLITKNDFPLVKTPYNDLGNVIVPTGDSKEILPFFEIDNLAQVLQLGTGTLVNSSTTLKTFIDYQGNIINTEAGEIVIDGARRVQNLLAYTEDMTNAYWTKTSTITGSTGEFVPGTSIELQKAYFDIGGQANVYSAIEATSTGVHRISLYLKAADTQWFSLYRLTAPAVHVNVDLVAGDISNIGADDAGIDDLGDGFYHVWLTVPLVSGFNTIIIYLTTAAYSVTLPATAHSIFLGGWTCVLDSSLSRKDYLPNLPTDYGYNVDGVKYYNTEADGLTLISPPPFMRHLPALTNNVFPSLTTDITDYSTSSNTVNRTISQTIFSHAAGVDVAGTEVELYHNDLSAVADTDYTVVVWMKMDDDTAPVVSSSSSDTGGDLGLILGGDFIDASASADHSITKKGDIYCVMMTGTSDATPTTATDNGLVQFSGNSDKKFEVYSVQLLDGIHLFPVYIPTVSAATSWTIDNHSISSTDNWFQDYGIVLIRFKARSGDIVGSKGIISLNGLTNSLIYQDSVGNVISSDDTTEIAVTASNDPVEDRLVAVCYTGSSRTVLKSDNGAAFSSTTGAYAGAFALTGGLISLYISASSKLAQSVQIYHDGLENMTIAEMKTWVEENAHAVTDIN